MKKLRRDPSFLQNWEDAKPRIYTPERNQKIGETHRLLNSTPEGKAKRLEHARDPERRQNISNAISKLVRNGGHKGGRGKHGRFFSKKNGRVYCPYRSLLEMEWHAKLEMDEHVLGFETRPPRIKYQNEGVTHHYHPDMLVYFKNGNQELWEVKPEGFFRNEKQKVKWKAARKWCRKRGIGFRVVGYSELQAECALNRRPRYE
jgi:hypothetical protein